MEIIKNLKYFYGLSGLIYKNNLFIEFLDIIDLIIKIPSFVHPLIAKLKLALLTQVDYSIDIDKYNFKEKKFSHFLNIIFDLIMEENIKDIKFSEFTDEQKHELERLEIFYIENEREKLFKEEEYKEKATSIFREARENPSLIEKLKEIFTPDEIKSILNDDPALLINRFTKKYYDSKAETDRCLKRLIELFESNKTIDKDALNEYLKSKTETDRLKKLEYLNFDISIDNVFLRLKFETALNQYLTETETDRLNELKKLECLKIDDVFLNLKFGISMNDALPTLTNSDFNNLNTQSQRTTSDFTRLKTLFEEEEYKKKATSIFREAGKIFREARKNQSLIEKLKEIFTPDEIKSILNDDPALLINRFTKKYYDSKAETDRCLKRLIELFESNKTIDKDALNEYLKSKTETDRLKKLEYLNFNILIDDVFLRSTNSTKLQKNILEFTKLIKAFKETVYSSTFKKKIKYYDFFNKMSTNYKPEISSSEITKRENIIKGTEEELQNQRIDKAMYNNKYYQNKFYLYLLFDGLGFNSKSFIDELQDSLSSGASDILIIRHLFTDTLVEFLDFFSSGNFTNKPKDWLSGLSGIMIFFNWQNGYCHNINSYDKSKKEFTLKLDNMYSSLEDIPTKEFAKKLAAAEAAKLAAETKGWSKYVKNMPKLLSPFGTKKPPTTTTGVPEGPNSGGTTKASERPNPTTTTGVPERLNSGETTKAPEGPNLGGTTGVPY